MPGPSNCRHSTTHRITEEWLANQPHEHRREDLGKLRCSFCWMVLEDPSLPV